MHPNFEAVVAPLPLSVVSKHTSPIQLAVYSSLHPPHLMTACASDSACLLILCALQNVCIIITIIIVL